jgi:TRAP-type transport system large permease protein
MVLLFFWIFLGLMVVGLPIVFALLAAPMIDILLSGDTTFLTLIAQRLYGGIDSFPLMALPFFILAGELMNHGGITARIVGLSQALIGHFRGGLAQVNILSSILFAGLSGSAVADTSALGSMLIPAMEKNGYSKKFAAAITAASSIIGPIIPPSGIMIMYAFIMNVSVGGLFAAGLLPGLLIGIGLMAITSYLAKKRNYPVAAQRASAAEIGQSLKDGFLPLLTPLIMLGGIVSGVFTPTEAAAVAAGYAIIVSVFILKTLNFTQLLTAFRTTAINSGVILLLVGAAVSFSSFVSLSGVPQTLSELLLSVTDNVYLLLFLLNILLLIIGMFLDAGPAILILGPILAPPVIAMGVEPLHFAVIMCVNLTIGLATPPMGLVLFVSASLTGDKVEVIAKEMLPFLAVEIAVMFIITFFPGYVLTIPRLLGFL